MIHADQQLRPSPRTLRLGAAFCIGGVGLCMAWLAGHMVIDAYQALAASRWVPIPGKISRSEVQEGCGIESAQFYPAVRYHYRYNGVRHSGTRIQFGAGLCGSERSAESIANSFPKGRRVTVYVDPDDPAESVLVAGRVHMGSWVALPIYLFLAIGALWEALQHLRGKRGL